MFDNGRGFGKDISGDISFVGLLGLAFMACWHAPGLSTTCGRVIYENYEIEHIVFRIGGGHHEGSAYVLFRNR